MGYFIARGLANNTATKLLAYDGFEQTEGNLTGKSLPLGGTWAGAGDSDDFKVIAAEDVARRSAKEDTSGSAGSFAIAGSEEPTTSKVSVSFEGAVPISGFIRRGVFLRYLDTENFFMAYITRVATVPTLVVARTVSGSATTMGIEPLNYAPGLADTATVSVFASTDGNYAAWAYTPGNQEPAALLKGRSTVLASGGALEKGKGGFYDANTSTSVLNTEYDNFSLLQGDPAGRVLHSGQTARLTSDGFFRDDEGGDYEGTASVARGMNLYLRPGLNRLVIAARRNDTETEESGPVTDKISTEVIVRERWLAPR